MNVAATCSAPDGVTPVFCEADPFVRAIDYAAQLALGLGLGLVAGVAIAVLLLFRR